MANGVEAGTGEATGSLVHVVAILVRRRRWVVGTAVVLAGVTAAVTLLKGRSYTSVSAFTAQSKRGPALSGLAAQFGISVSGAEASQSPQFYADFVRSRQVLGATAETRFPDARGAMSDLGTLLDIARKDSALTRERVITELGRRVVASVNTRTGVVRVTTRMTTGELARAVNLRLLSLLNEFNLRTRQSQASAERAFTDRRLAEAKQELRAAEDELQGFLQRNRDYRSSPQLTFAADRLERALGVRQQIVSTLAEAYEQARIEEVRDTPAITVVEQAEVPVRPDPRRLLPLVLLALVGGAAIGSVAALARESLVGLARSADPAVNELRAELASTALLGRLVGRKRDR